MLVQQRQVLTWMPVSLMGEMVKETAEHTKENDSLGCAKLVVFM